MPFPTAPQVNLPACSSHCPFDAERQAGSCECLIEIIGLTRLGIKPKSTTAKADTLGTRSPQLLPSPTGISGNQLKESLLFTDDRKVFLIWFVCTKPNQNGGHPDSNNETCLTHALESLITVNVTRTSRVFCLSGWTLRLA